MSDTEKDIEKIKIDILRDAVKDASDTIRALDRKVVFLVSYNTLFLGVIGTILSKKDILLLNKISIIGLSVIAICWVLLLMYTMMNVSPSQNPSDVLYDKDKMFGFNMFFVLAGKDQKHSLKYLLDNFNDEISDIENAKKLLFKEVTKLSYIRDDKIRKLQFSIKVSACLTFIFILMFLFYIVK